MTERQIGTFTIPTHLLLTPDHRARLERMVRERRLDPADVVSQIVAETGHEIPQVAPAAERTVSVPIRVYLTPEQRALLEGRAHEQDVDIAEIISQIVAAHLEAQPAAPAAPAAQQPPAPADLRQRRAELARLRARRDASGAAAPAWLHGYIADLESEIRRLEGNRP